MFIGFENENENENVFVSQIIEYTLLYSFVLTVNELPTFGF